MPSYNKVILVGNLTRDPEVKYLANENMVGNFGIAVNRKSKGGDEVTFVDIEAWGKTAELAGQYLTKGRECLIEGRLKLDQWEDQNGSRRSKLKVVAERVVFLGAKGEGHTNRQEPTSHAPVQVDGGDEPPF